MTFHAFRQIYWLFGRDLEDVITETMLAVMFTKSYEIELSSASKTYCCTNEVSFNK